jgi:hypothetical protein
MSNMRKHAVLDDNTVVDIKVISESEFSDLAKKHQLILDIHDLLVEPELGWVLVGNQLQPSASQMPDLPKLIKSRIKHYQDNASELLRDLYAENTLLGITVEQSDQMFDDFADVLTRIREGAWPTALHRLSQKQPSGFVTQEMINRWSALIASRML